MPHGPPSNEGATETIRTPPSKPPLALNTSSHTTQIVHELSTYASNFFFLNYIYIYLKTKLSLSKFNYF